MSWTKRQFVEQAFEEVGYASYAYDLEPEQLQSACRKLDAMMGTWNGKGIRLAYPIPTSPENTDLDTETNVPDSANETIYLNLAIRIAPMVGKMITPETKASAKAGYNVLLARATFPNEQQLPASMPIGAGYKRSDTNFVDPPTDPLIAGQDNELVFE